MLDMLKNRVIPTLLLKNGGLVKGRNFKNHTYIGDALNSIRIFNNKNVDELVLLDINASKSGKPIDLDFVEKVADECNMPFGVGGGIKTVDEIRQLIRAGAEKVLLNTSAIKDPSLITKAINEFGSQCIVISIDYKIDWFGKPKVYSHCGERKTNLDPLEWAQKVTDLGAGEILLTSINNEGKRIGFDLKTIRKVAKNISIPLIASGGAEKKEDFKKAFEAGASAAAAGTMFMFTFPLRSVLISYAK